MTALPGAPPGADATPLILHIEQPQASYIQLATTILLLMRTATHFLVLEKSGCLKTYQTMLMDIPATLQHIDHHRESEYTGIAIRSCLHA